MGSNWELLETNQYLLDSCILEMESLNIEINKLKDVATWVNEQPYPYQPERIKREHSKDFTFKNIREIKNSTIICNGSIKFEC